MDHMETDLPDPQYHDNQRLKKKTCNTQPLHDEDVIFTSPIPTIENAAKSGDSSLPPQNLEMTSSLCPTTKQTESGENPDQTPAPLSLLENPQILTDENSHEVPIPHGPSDIDDNPIFTDNQNENDENLTHTPKLIAKH